MTQADRYYSPGTIASELLAEAERDAREAREALATMEGVLGDAKITLQEMADDLKGLSRFGNLLPQDEIRPLATLCLALSAQMGRLLRG